LVTMTKSLAQWTLQAAGQSGMALDLGPINFGPENPLAEMKTNQHIKTNPLQKLGALMFEIMYTCRSWDRIFTPTAELIVSIAAGQS